MVWLTAFTSAVITLASSAQGQSQPKEKPTVNVDDAINSVVAGEVKGNVVQYNYYQSQDPTDRNFSASLTLHIQEKFKASLESPASGVHHFVYRTNDPAFRREAPPGSSFILVAGSTELVQFFFGPRARTCKLPNDNVVAGQYTVTSLTGKKVDIHIELLGEDSALLKRVCRGLAEPLEKGGDPEEDLNRFDELSGEDSKMVLISFLPDVERNRSFEEGYARDYWHGLELGLEISKLNAMEQFLGRARSKQVTRDIVSRGKADISFELDDRFPLDGAFPQISRRTYGSRLDRLAADWNSFLGQGRLRWDGRYVPLAQGGRLAPRVTRISYSDLESGKAWEVIGETGDYLYQLACLAGYFAVQRGYSSPADVPFSRQCAS